MLKPTQPICAALAALVAAGALLAATPVHASADPAIAPGPGGSAAFLFRQDPNAGNRLHERTLAGNGVLGESQAVSWSSRNVVEQAIGTDASGNAVIAWSSDVDNVRTAYVRRRGADGSLSAVQRLSVPTASAVSLALAVEPDGDAFAVWRRSLAGKEVVQGRRRAADGTLGPVQNLSYAGGDASSPELGVAADGTVVVAWVRQTATEEFVQMRTVAPGGTVGDYQRLSPSGADIGDLSVSMNAAGKAVVAWWRKSGQAFAFESRARSATGTLGVVQTIASPTEFGGYTTVAMNAAGRTAYAWGKLAGEGHAVKGRIRQADGALGPQFDVSEGAGVAPRVAVDPDGHATFAWHTPGAVGAVHSRRRTAVGAMGPVRTVSDPSVDSLYPSLVVDAAGKATVTWASVAGDWFARTLTSAGTFSAIHALTAGS